MRLKALKTPLARIWHVGFGFASNQDFLSSQRWKSRKPARLVAFIAVSESLVYRWNRSRRKDFFYFFYENLLTHQKMLCTPAQCHQFVTNLVATAFKTLKKIPATYCFYWKIRHWLKIDQFVWMPLLKGILNRTNKLPTKLSTAFVDTFDDSSPHFYGAINFLIMASTVSVCSWCNQWPAFLTVTTLRAANTCAKSCFVVLAT